MYTQQLNASTSTLGDVDEMQEDVQKAVEEMVRLRSWVFWGAMASDAEIQMTYILTSSPLT